MATRRRRKKRKNPLSPPTKTALYVGAGAAVTFFVLMKVLS